MKTKTYAFDLARAQNEAARTEVVNDGRDAVERFAPMRAVAQALSRRGLAGAKVELANHALALAVDLVLEADADGAKANQDIDGRILVPLPWTRTGGAAWGLRRTEQRAFNLIMQARSKRESQPLFIYDCASKGQGFSKVTRAA